MTIAVDAGLTKLEVLGLGAASLLEEANGAVVVGSMIGSLRGDQEDRLAGQVDEPAGGRGRGLEHALNVIIVSGSVTGLDEVGGGVGHSRRVGDGDISQTPRSAGLGAEDGLAERGAGGLEQDEGLGELGTGISNEDWHEAALAVANQNHRLADLVEEGGAGILNSGLLVGGVVDELDVGAVEGVEVAIAHDTRAGPLGVLASLGPQHVVLDGGEALLNDLGRVGGRLGGAIRGHPGGTTAQRLVDDVDLVALLDEARRPAAGAVRLVEEVLQRR